MTDSTPGSDSETGTRPPTNPSATRKRAADVNSGLAWAPPKKQCRTDPLVGHGKHFGRTIRTFCHVQTIIAHGLSRTMQLDLGRITEEELSYTDLLEQRLYRRLLALSPGLEERLNTSSEEEVHYIAAMITKGISQSKSDDTKSLKSAVVDWITPLNEVLSPPLLRNVKHGRGYHHNRTGFLLCPVNFNWDDPKIRRDLAEGNLVPTGDLWPRFIYRNYEYNACDVWEGLFRSHLLVKAFKHVFTSPSSVNAPTGVATSTRSSNARIHGMGEVTLASIAYIATQVRFALLASNVFSQTDKVTDSEGFYNHMIDLLEDEEEQDEVASLLRWWNQQIFPTTHAHSRPVHADSVLAKVKERRRLIKEGLWSPTIPQQSAPSTSGYGLQQGETASA